MVPMAPSHRSGRSAKRVRSGDGTSLRPLARPPPPGGGGAGEPRARARAAAARAATCEGPREPHHRAERTHRLRTALAAVEPAPGGDHVTRLEGEETHRLLLEGPEVGFAPLGEDRRDRAALAGGDHVVG